MKQFIFNTGNKSVCIYSVLETELWVSAEYTKLLEFEYLGILEARI
jgi:hypothetical protein